ncbi:MAG: hypothetical protein GY805_25035 [Chloroflexi bacterium]|nr:hypothetical protein [Chloroflexota bacterium]
MRQPINFTQSNLDELAKQTTGLSDWLEKKEILTDSNAAISKELTTVTSYIVGSGLLILLDKALPASACWVGGCFL